MNPEEFRHHGHAVIDWIADYWSGIENHPVQSRAEPGELLACLPEHPPERPEPFEAVLSDLTEKILPGITHWQHPAFFGYFPANTSGPAVLGDLLSSGLGIQGMLWATSPACTELEIRVTDWLAELLGLPTKFRSTSAGGGVIQDSASSATLVATLAALHRAGGGSVNREGIRRQYVVYTSAEAHSSIEKAVRIAGLGTANLRIVSTDPQTQAMNASHLEELIKTDLANAALPTLVVATIGTTATTAIDPLPAIGRLCQQHQIWLHVDAAYAGPAALCEELRWTHDGVEHADSYCTDPHKWILTNFDCDAFWVADRSALIGALSVLPEYLRNDASESGKVIDYRDWQISLGRRFRALKLWAVIRCHGAEGLRAHIRDGVRLAQAFASWIHADGRFEITTPHPFGLVCFRLRANNADFQDTLNSELLRRLNANGQLYLTHTRVNDRYTLRMAIGGTRTELRHVEAAWNRITEIANVLLTKPTNPPTRPGMTESAYEA
jgi:aromatic-L-amino-acid decarboxylase